MRLACSPEGLPEGGHVISRGFGEKKQMQEQIKRRLRRTLHVEQAASHPLCAGLTRSLAAVVCPRSRSPVPLRRTQSRIGLKI